jgi:hypothetical protein
MAEASDEARWSPLVAHCLTSLMHDRVIDPDLGTYIWNCIVEDDRFPTLDGFRVRG